MTARNIFFLFTILATVQNFAHCEQKTSSAPAQAIHAKQTTTIFEADDRYVSDVKTDEEEEEVEDERTSLAPAKNVEEMPESVLNATPQPERSALEEAIIKEVNAQVTASMEGFEDSLNNSASGPSTTAIPELKGDFQGEQSQRYYSNGAGKGAYEIIGVAFMIFIFWILSRLFLFSLRRILPLSNITRLRIAASGFFAVILCLINLIANGKVNNADAVVSDTLIIFLAAAIARFTFELIALIVGDCVARIETGGIIKRRLSYLERKARIGE